MKKLIRLFIVCSLLLVSCVPSFAQATSQVIIPGVDTATIFETLSAILAAIVGHYTINSKWTSIIKWLLTAVNWLIWVLSKIKALLDILNKSNLGESAKTANALDSKTSTVQTPASSVQQ